MSLAQPVSSSPSSLERRSIFVRCSACRLAVFTGEKKPRCLLLCCLLSRAVDCSVDCFRQHVETAMSIGLPYSPCRFVACFPFSQEMTPHGFRFVSYFVALPSYFAVFPREKKPVCRFLVSIDDAALSVDSYLSLCRLLGHQR
jgi:hypothetical protein